LNTVAHTTFATCNNGSAIPVIDLASKRLSDLTAAERDGLNTLLNNAALAIGCNYDLNANPIHDVDRDDEHESSEPTQQANEQGARGKQAGSKKARRERTDESERGDHGERAGSEERTLGFAKWYGTHSDPAKGCGIVYFTRSVGCAFPMANTPSPPALTQVTPGVATEPKLLAKHRSTPGLGLPTSFPKANEDSQVSWQRFQWGYITSAQHDGVAYAIGGNSPGRRRFSYQAAVTYGRDFDVATVHDNHFPLASDPVCVDRSGSAPCSDGLLGFRSTTHPYLGFQNYYVLQANSPLAFKVGGPIAQKYYALAATPEAGCLGLPIGSEQCIDGGCTNTFQSFAHGNIYTNTSQAGTHPALVVDANALTAYKATGGPLGPLGLPLADAPSCGSGGPGTTAFTKGTLFNVDATHVNVGPLPIQVGPTFPDQLQVGSYRFATGEYQSFATYPFGDAGDQLHYFFATDLSPAFTPIALSPIPGGPPGLTGSVIQVTDCPSASNNVPSNGYFGDYGDFFGINDIAPTSANPLGFPWVEVLKTGGTGRGVITNEGPHIDETCHVFLSNPYFTTARLNSSTVHLKWNAPIPAGTESTATIDRYAVGLDGTVGPHTDTTVRILSGMNEAIDSSGIPDRLNCYQVFMGGVGGDLRCMYLPMTTFATSISPPPEIADPEFHVHRAQLAIRLVSAAPPEVPCPQVTANDCAASFIPLTTDESGNVVTSASCTLDGCVLDDGSNPTTCVPATICLGNLDTSINSVGFSERPGHIAVAARLQGNDPLNGPYGNISYLDTTIADWTNGSSQTYDLDLSNVRTMSDITQISLQALDKTMRVCVAEITLLVDDDGSPNANRVAFHRSYGDDFNTACGPDSIVRNSIRSDVPMLVSFSDLRSSPDWQEQIASWNDSSSFPLGHYTGIPAVTNSNDLKAFLMGQFSTFLALSGANFREEAMTVTSSSSDKAHVIVYFQQSTGVKVEFDLVLQPQFGCVCDAQHRTTFAQPSFDPAGLYAEITGTRLTVQNVHVTPTSEGAIIGADLAAVFVGIALAATGNLAAALIGYGLLLGGYTAQGLLLGAALQDAEQQIAKTVSALGAPPTGGHFAFTQPLAQPPDHSAVGFGIVDGQNAASTFTCMQPQGCFPVQ
jgi:hypothetical protein